MNIQYKPIGTIHSPFKILDETPLQSKLSKGAKGIIELETEYMDGLHDLDKFTHIILIYHMHLVEYSGPVVKPSHSRVSHGVFATRFHQRPNPIGISVVRLEGLSGNTLYVENIDVVDNTPLLDIKPFITILERQYGTNLGWLSGDFGHL
jgi:tRNA-Thr(GGU) m(6)t(6)A37 methyltransferase TsaA